MSLEPAIALLIGLVVLHQVPAALALIGMALVVAAGIGAARTGARSPTGSVGADTRSRNDGRGQHPDSTPVSDGPPDRLDRPDGTAEIRCTADG